RGPPRARRVRPLRRGSGHRRPPRRHRRPRSGRAGRPGARAPARLLRAGLPAAPAARARGGALVTPHAPRLVPPTAALVAAAVTPWGLGGLALVAYVPAFVALARLRRPLHGAIVAGVAAAGLNSVAYESAQGLFSGAFLAAVALATLPHLGVGALAVGVKDA